MRILEISSNYPFNSVVLKVLCLSQVCCISVWILQSAYQFLLLKMSAGILISIALNLYISLGRMNTLTPLSLVTHEHAPGSFNFSRHCFVIFGIQILEDWIPHTHTADANVKGYNHFGKVWQSPKKLNLNLAYDPAILLPGISQNESMCPIKTWTGMFQHLHL